MSDFAALAKSRRSANKFLPGVKISERELYDLFEVVKYSPSAFNLQHAHYIAVTTPEKKEQVYEAAFKQYKVQTASAVVAVFGSLEAYKSAAEIYEGMLHLGIFTKQQYDYEVSSVHSFYENRGSVFMRDEAVRNASLSAMTFMMAAKDKGWDTCPMIGFDPELLAKTLHAPDHFIPVMLIAVGKEDTSSQRVRGYRKPLTEFVSLEQF